MPRLGVVVNPELSPMTWFFAYCPCSGRWKKTPGRRL